jgi:hypothetical protein
VSQRTWQAPAGPSRTPERARPSQTAEADTRTTETAKSTETANEAGGVRLTGRGALVVVFVLCLAGLAVSGWLHWGLLAGSTFMAASCLAAARTQRSDLLVVAVSPPALFLIAVICVKALGSAGDLLSTAEGTLITLADNAPWLLAGTLLSVIIAFSRGMWDNVRTLGKDLRGDPIRQPR